MTPTVFQPDLLKGRAALVTGGGTGICRGIALAFAAHGCDVAITSRKADHLEPTAAELRSRGVRGVAKVADVRNVDAVGEMVSTVIGELGRLDILVNGAAGNFICLAENLSPNGFGTVVDIDLKGTFNVSKAALPHLKTRGGSVLNISATLPYLGTMGQSHAAAAKAGIDSLTKVLACEWGPHQIRVNGIAPGPVETEGYLGVLTKQDPAVAKKAYDAVASRTRMGRWGKVEEIAYPCIFLASEASSFMTGATIIIDGGPSPREGDEAS